MKKIINAPEALIEDYIEGLVASAPQLARVEGWPVVVRSEGFRKSDDRVALISGGGSGHEPAHAGYVGTGMLDAAVLGPVFTSPSVDSIFAAIRAVATSAGVLLIVKNYTGDRLNFGLAAEMARADGIDVEMVLVAEDAALGDASRAGRRGLTATVLAHKVAGAAAENGRSLSQTAEVARRLLSGAATMGVALGACTVPGGQGANFSLGDDEVEWGLGIHGEAGKERGAMVPSAVIAARLTEILCADRRWDRDSDVVVMINSLGGTPDLELRILQGDVLRELASRRLRVRMTWAGPFLTSLEMPGASVTIAAVDAEMLELLSEPADVLAFPSRTRMLEASAVLRLPPRASATRDDNRIDGVARAHASVRIIANALVRAEGELTELDRRVGDGDLGINLARGARSLLAAERDLDASSSPRALLQAVAERIRSEVGGTSGPLYSLFVLAVADALPNDREPSVADWTSAAAAGTAMVREIGGAAPGDSTMVDALQPAVDALVARGGDVAAAAVAARAGAARTAALLPSLGRSSYVGDRAVGVPDPGAVAIAVQFEALANAAARS